MATFTTGGADVIFGSELSHLKTMLYTNVPKILEIGFALIGLCIAIMYVYRWIWRERDKEAREFLRMKR